MRHGSLPSVRNLSFGVFFIVDRGSEPRTRARGGPKRGVLVRGPPLQSYGHLDGGADISLSHLWLAYTYSHHTYCGHTHSDSVVGILTLWWRILTS